MVDTGCDYHYPGAEWRCGHPADVHRPPFIPDHDYALADPFTGLSTRHPYDVDPDPAPLLPEHPCPEGRLAWACVRPAGHDGRHRDRLGYGWRT